jgi:hypothetical protein
MPAHGPFVRALAGLGLVCGAVVALASVVVLHGAALVAVGFAGAIAAAVAAAATSGAGNRAAVVAALWKAAATTVGVIMLVVGVVVLAGGVVAALVSGLAVVGGAGWLLRARRARHAGARAQGRPAGRADDGPAPALLAPWLGGRQPPVSLLPTAVLGSEWLRTTQTLVCRLDPDLRQAILRRRQEILDELDRRDPAGFARWLAAGAAADSDPAPFVRDSRSTGTDAA